MTRRRPIHLDRLTLFVAVAEAGGFTAAASRLGTTKQLVSQQLVGLEAELGAALFTRTTRRVTLTEAGERLLGMCSAPLQELSSAIEQFHTSSARPTGTLRITTAPEYAANVLGPLLAEFAREHPELAIDLLATHDVLDLVAERIDLALRFGWPRDSSLRRTQLGTFEQYVVAAPEYIARTGSLKQPEDLVKHSWVALSLLRAPLSWHFEGPKGRTQQVRVRASLRGNSPEAVQGLVRGGAGISVLADFAIEEDLQSGRLVRLLSAWSLPRGGLHALYPEARHVPTKVRAFLDFFRARAKDRPSELAAKVVRR